MRVLKTKYIVVDGVFTAVCRKSRMSHAWKNLYAVWDKVKEGMSFLVGDGQMVRF